MPLRIVRNDITKIACDAIVNSTNEMLVGAGGADFAVHTAAGKGLDEECAKLTEGGFRLGMGQCIVTDGYNLPAKHIIHTCAPSWAKNGSRAGMIKNCYLTCLREAIMRSYTSVAFPLIAAGTYKCPKYRAMEIALSAFEDYRDYDIDIILVVFEREAVDEAKKLPKDVISSIDEFIADNYVSDAMEDVRLQSRRFRENLNYAPREGRTPRIGRVSEDADYSVGACLDAALPEPEEAQAPKASAPKLPDFGKNQKIEKPDGFAEVLLSFIDRTGLKDSKVYNKALITRDHMSKIKKGSATYKPKKETVAQFAIVLKLSESDARILFESAGYSLSYYTMFDMIIIWCLKNGVDNIMDVNAILSRYDQKELGTKK